MTPATDVPGDQLGDPGGFVAACKPTDLVYFALNVGDGDTQLLLLPADAAGRRRCIVVDCVNERKLSALIDALAQAGVIAEVEPLIALVVATHPHLDHIGGMGGLLRRFKDGHLAELWESGYYQPSSAYVRMMSELEDSEIGHLQPTAGTTRFFGQVKLTVLAPSVALRGRYDSYGIDVNNASIALKVDYPAARTYERDGDRAYVRLPTMQTLILGADAQTLSWGYVLADFPQLGPERSAVTTALQKARGSEPLNADVFKVPHHGSKHGLSLELVETVKPSVSIVSSVREAGKYRFPHEVTQLALREALDPISSKANGRYRSDAELGILYTGSEQLDGNGRSVGPLGTVGLLIGIGRRREVWRFGDGPRDPVALDQGCPVKP